MSAWLVPTAIQQFHSNYNRHGDFDRAMNDFVMGASDMLGIDAGLTTTERELALSESFNPSEVTIVNGVGYVNDGITTLYDDDGDGSWDAALQTANGTTYEFGTSGWSIFGE
ncbi:hypothetical protein [Brevundimonas sp. Root1279]|uniref:hypothetical protein n=1 Tax=Brevundimonas sp. Root1279 TaxID=1736443 RepID=UPI000712C779|nr:hypothetical protein [Brevundimonas sp. Root1279]KQW79771.1 hypothetical protein ASC65_14595 [Brevundimonas sp. Root1279]